MSDIALTSTQVIAKNLTIDLNGKNITATNARALHIKNGEVTITGEGRISANGAGLDADSSVIRVGDGSTNGAAAKLTIDKDVTVSTDKCYGITAFGVNNTDGKLETSDIEVVVKGTVSVTSERNAIAGNGNSRNSATKVTIEKGANVTSEKDYAIYHPGNGTLTVNGKVRGK